MCTDVVREQTTIKPISTRTTFEDLVPDLSFLTPNERVWILIQMTTVHTLASHIPSAEEPLVGRLEFYPRTEMFRH